MHDATTTLSEFLAAASAKQPTPGGGAVAALAGALAAAMGEMVLNYSVGKKDLAAHSGHNAQTVRELTAIRHDLLRLMVKDQAAFAELTAAKKAGEDSLPLVRICVDVPRAISRHAIRTLELAIAVAPTSNPFLLSDLAVCGECAMAALRSGLHSAAANLGDILEPERSTTSNDLEAVRVEGVRLIQQLTSAIAARQAGS
jgi:formiminotetrahydrofolate cyclodeaminase